MVVLRSAHHHKKLGMFKIRAAEFPEASTNGVDHARGHVHRTKASVSRIVGCAELSGKEPCEGLHLVATGEERKLFGVGGTKMRKPIFQHAECLRPFDGFKGRVTAIAPWDSPQGFRNSGGRLLLHDSRRPFGADHTLVERVFGVAVDVTNLAVTEVHPNATATCAHVAGGGLDVVALGAWVCSRIVDWHL